MKIQPTTSTVSLTDVLHNARDMRDEAIARLLTKAWHGFTGAFGKVFRVRVRQSSAVRLVE